jgi:glycosyltransferase involved in cell wall biosynthesis
MKEQTLFIDITTSLKWGQTTAVGIVRVEHYIIQYVLEHYKGPIGFVVFESSAICYRSAGQSEIASMLQYLYSVDSEPSKPTKIELMRTLSFDQVKTMSSDFFEARIKTRLNEIGVPKIVSSVGGATFKNAAAIASVVVKAIGPNGTALPTLGDVTIADRQIQAFEPFRDKKTRESASLLIAGLTWDYMYYPYLVDLKKNSELQIAHVIYDTIPVDFPQFVPHASHLYHRHFVEVAQVADVLYAISDYSASRFTETILKPNLIDKTISSCGLPDFLSQCEGAKSPKPIASLTRSKFVVYCSTIEVRKNHLMLINIWDRLLRTYPANQVPKLVLVGKWGWAFEAVKNQIEQNPILRNHVVVLSNLPDASLIWLYQHAQFTVFPSFSEGWGLAVTESLNWGTPVILSDAPALNEAAQGLMPRLEPLDFNAWLHTIEELVTSPDALTALREKAREFSPLPIENFAKGLLDLMANRKVSAAQ